MERSYDDRQKSQQDRSRQPDQAPNAAGNPSQRGGAQGSAADLDKRGRAGLTETEADGQRSDRKKSEF